MYTNKTKQLLNVTILLFTMLALVLAPGAIREASAAPADIAGYVDQAYGAAVKPEPTEDVSESKLWYNDGYWWGILFDSAAGVYKIYWLDLGRQTWRATNVVLDSRIDDTGEVATRHDALWDGSKLYIASHIKVENPSKVNSEDNWGRLYRYSYNSATKAYTLDNNYPVTVNEDKTATLVLDKDSTGRLWVTYVSRIPNPDPMGAQEYNVYVNYTQTAGTDHVWADPINLKTVNSTAATVDELDATSLVAFSTKIGLIWSNELDGEYYFAEHSAASSPTTGWSIQTIDTSPYNLQSNDHIKMVANSAGQVFASVKTHNTTPTDPLLGVIARSATGVFSFHPFSPVSSLDTRPTLLLDESANRLVMFVTSNATGGVICYKEMVITNPLSNMQFPAGNCSDNGSGAPLFIASTQYDKIDNATSTKDNVNSSTGAVILATDDVNGSLYLHNVRGNPLAVITDTAPARGASLSAHKVIVSLTFSHAMNPATLNANTMNVIGPAGELAGDVTYSASTRTATFISDGQGDDGTYRVELTNAVRDAGGRAIFNTGEVLRFNMTFVESHEIYIPIIRH
jgi:hypothetical protein